MTENRSVSSDSGPLSSPYQITQIQAVTLSRDPNARSAHALRKRSTDRVVGCILPLPRFRVGIERVLQRRLAEEIPWDARIIYDVCVRVCARVCVRRPTNQPNQPAIMHD